VGGLFRLQSGMPIPADISRFIDDIASTMRDANLPTIGLRQK
jgi:hypothetical protein